MSFQLLILLCLSVSLSALAAALCTHSRQCDDGNSETFDVCMSTHQECFFISRSVGTILSGQTVSGLDVGITSLSALKHKTNSNPLTIPQKRAVVNSMRRIFAEFNPHIILQLTIHHYDIIAELDRIMHDLNLPALQNQTNFDFHILMQSVLSRLNDRHSMYYAPDPLRSSFAFLGFFVREYFVNGDNYPNGQPRRHYVVYDVPPFFEKIAKGENKSFVEGVELLSWDDMKIDKAVRAIGRHSSAANFAAQLSQGVQLLTSRVLASDAIPLKSKVRVGYRSLSGKKEFIDVPWTFLRAPAESMGLASRTVQSQSRKSRVWMKNSVPRHPFTREERIDMGLRRETSTVRVARENRTEVPIREPFDQLFKAEIVHTKLGDIGRLLLPSFEAEVTKELVFELGRILELMPPQGLVLDVRKNIGGNPDYSKAITELISDADVLDQKETLRAKPLITEILSSAVFDASLGEKELFHLKGMKNALRTANKIGENFTGPTGFVFINEERLQQVYRGQVFTLVDGLTYSAGDIFAALQVDQNASTLVGTSDTTGAGGASMQMYGNLPALAPGVVESLPGGIDFSTAFARIYRTGLQQGAALEFFGVSPVIRYYPSFVDALHDDQDLFTFLAERVSVVLPKI